MENFVTAITEALTGVFSAILQAFAGIGDLIFVIDSSGAGGITGLSSFGWVVAALIGIPLASWLFAKAIGLISKLFKKA